VNLRYTSTVTNVTTGPEVPASASVLKNVDVIGAQGMTLGSDMTVIGTVTFAEGAGSIITDANTLTLGLGASVNGEAANRIVAGNLSTTRVVGTGSSTFGGIGIEIAAGTDNIANVTVTRITGAGGVVTVGSNSGIARKWTIAADNAPVSGRDVTFSWVSSDDNGKTFSGTNKANAYRYDGAEWKSVGALTDVSAGDPRSMTVQTTAFSDWTVSDEESPLEIPVAVITISADDIDMGSVSAGQFRDTVVTIGNTGNDTLKITSIVSNNAMFVTSLAAAEIPPGASVSDTIRYAPVSGGAHSANIVITSNAATSPDTIEVTGFGLTYGLSLSSSLVDAGLVTVGLSKDTVITLTNTGNDTVMVVSILSGNPAFTVRPSALTIPPGGSATDTIRFTPAAAGKDSGYVVITSNASSSPDTLKVLGFGATYGLTYSLSSVDFGKVLVYSSKDTLLTISNTGNQPVSITNVQYTSSTFLLLGGTGFIAAGATVNDTIRFAPTAAGQVSAKIIITHTAGAPDTIDVTANAVLTGIAGESLLPTEYAISQNYPNPFNPSTTIEYSLPERSTVTISVHNLLGQRIMDVVSSPAEAGFHRTTINASNLPSGVYFYTMRAVSGENPSRVFTMTRKMILTK
jgi:hypothetical protein